ncbi:MAG: transketolase, partial [Candidatus Thiodiazotropha sp.]
YGWHVVRDVDGHDADALNQAIEAAKADGKPSLICCKTTIGFGSPNLAGSHDCHGAPLGAEEVAATREQLGWSYAPFEVPDEIYAGWDAKASGAEAEGAWNDKFSAYEAEFPELAAEFKRRMDGDLPANWEADAARFVTEMNAKAESPATRKASQISLNGYGPLLPEFLGGSADLTPSNLTSWSGSKAITEGHVDGNYLSYGVREFGMSAIMNGIALHGGFIPYGGTFLMFSEYARNALRMAALMKLRSIFVYTHDSIGLGEDGPTHQPIEQIPTLRMIPNMDLWRPCDAVETAVAWKAAVEKSDGPTCLVFSRQNLAHQPRSEAQIANIAKGGYVLVDCDGTPDVIVIATGSEVDIAVKAAAESSKKVRVVSMPNTKVFDAQDAAYRESVLPAGVTARVAVEAAVTDGWYKYVGLNGKVIGINRFGESAPAGQLFKEFGFTAENVLAAIDEVSA